MTGREIRGLLYAMLTVRRRAHPFRWTVGIAALGIANLFFCAYVEQFADATTGPSALLLLLAAESCFFLTAIGGVFFGDLEGILRKTTLLPVPTNIRYQFALMGVIRNPVILVLWGTAVFAVVVLGSFTGADIGVRALLVFLLGALILISFCTLLFAYMRTRSSAAPVLALTALVLLGMILGTAATSTQHLLAAVLPLQWTSEGIAAAQGGDYVRSAFFAVLLSIPSAGCLYWGSRYA